jgi:hypothetical protein
MEDNVFAQQTMQEIVGEKLNMVLFGVFGHLSLDFNGPSLVAHNPVSLKTGGRVLRFGEPGFCDALCGQLGLTVSDVQISDDELRILFADQSSFAMSLREADYVGPEAGIYYSADKGIMVLR